MKNSDTLVPKSKNDAPFDGDLRPYKRQNDDLRGCSLFLPRLTTQSHPGNFKCLQ